MGLFKEFLGLKASTKVFIGFCRVLWGFMWFHTASLKHYFNGIDTGSKGFRAWGCLGLCLKFHVRWLKPIFGVGVC